MYEMSTFKFDYNGAKNVDDTQYHAWYSYPWGVNVFSPPS